MASSGRMWSDTTFGVTAFVGGLLLASVALTHAAGQAHITDAVLGEDRKDLAGSYEIKRRQQGSGATWTRSFPLFRTRSDTRSMKASFEVPKGHSWGWPAIPTINPCSWPSCSNRTATTCDSRGDV